MTKISIWSILSLWMMLSVSVGADEILDLLVSESLQSISSIAQCANQTNVLENLYPNLTDANLAYQGSVIFSDLDHYYSDNTTDDMMQSHIGVAFGAAEKEGYQEICEQVGGYFFETSEETVTISCTLFQAVVSTTISNLGGCIAFTDECLEIRPLSYVTGLLEALGMECDQEEMVQEEIIQDDPIMEVPEAALQESIPSSASTLRGFSCTVLVMVSGFFLGW